MKILNVYLYDISNSDNIANIIEKPCCFGLYEFETIINDIETKNLNSIYSKYTKDENFTLNTTVLAALNTRYFEIFNAIVVYGKSMYIQFIYDGVYKIDYKVYNYNNYRDYAPILYNKEIRLAHNLYKLIVPEGAYFHQINENKSCTLKVREFLGFLHNIEEPMHYSVRLAALLKIGSIEASLNHIQIDKELNCIYLSNIPDSEAIITIGDLYNKLSKTDYAEYDLVFEIRDVIKEEGKCRHIISKNQNIHTIDLKINYPFFGDDDRDGYLSIIFKYNKELLKNFMIL